jgi:hypothetical protein
VTVSAFVQDPNAVRKYGIDWTLDPGDTITASAWTLLEDDGVTTTTAMTMSTPQFTNAPSPKTVVTLSYPAPVVGTTVYAVNHVTTAGGGQEDHTLIITFIEE